ncbi:MAG: YfhO family protein [Candidatus Magnetomorum sp.]|nr:YfhO family protein [Candidatus Magnetomorum sp.]
MISARKVLWGPIILFLCLMVFFHEIFFSGKSFLLRDLFCDFFPWRLFAKDALLSFHLPLWNPYSNMGQPFMANPQSAVFYPFHAIFLFMDAVWAMKISIVFHVFVSGLLMYRLVRHLSLSLIPALFVSLVWMFNTHMMVQLEFHSVLTCLTWMPLAVLQAIKITENVKHHLQGSLFQIFGYIIKDIAILIMTLVIQFFAGNPQPLLFTLLIVCSYMLIPGLIHKNLRFFSIQLLILSICGIFSLGVVLPQLILTWELLPLSIRAQEIDPGLTSGSVHPFHLISLFLPFFWGEAGYFHHWLGKDWSLIEYWLGACYVGIPSLMLITFSLPGIRSSYARQPAQKEFFRPALFFWMMGIIGSVIALGHYTPIYMIFYHVVPLFDRLRWPGNALCVPVFCFSILSGYGFQWLINTYQRSDQHQTRWIYGLVGIWFGVLFIAFVLYINTGDSPFLSAWKTCFDDHHLLINQRIADMGFFILCLSLSLILIIIMQFPRIQRLVAWSLIGLLFVNLYHVSKTVIAFSDDDLYRYTPQTTLHRLTNKPLENRIHSTYGAAQQWLYGMDDPEKFDWAMNASVGDTWLPFHIRKTWGGGSLRLASVTNIHALLENVPSDMLNRLADILGIEYVIHGAPLVEVLTQQTPKKINLTQRPTALPRSFFVSNWKSVHHWTSAIALLVSKEFNPSHQAIIEISDKQTIPLSKDKQTSNRVLHIQDDWNQTDIVVETPESGLLILNDPWYPGWQAWINGKQQSIYPVNGIFRGVFIPAGIKNIKFVYAPDALNEAFGVALFSIILFVFFAQWAQSNVKIR